MIDKIDILKEVPLMDEYSVAVKLNEIIEKVNELDERTSNMVTLGGSSPLSGSSNVWDAMGYGFRSGREWEG